MSPDPRGHARRGYGRHGGLSGSGEQPLLAYFRIVLPHVRHCGRHGLCDGRHERRLHDGKRHESSGRNDLRNGVAARTDYDDAPSAQPERQADAGNPPRLPLQRHGDEGCYLQGTV